MKDNLNKKFNEGAAKPSPEIDQQLIDAVDKGNVTKVAGLIKKGANVLARNEQALMLAAIAGDLEIVKLLVAAGSLGTALIYPASTFAASQGHHEVAAYLEQALDNQNKSIGKKKTIRPNLA